MMMKRNLWVDLGIFAIFLAASEPELTGLAVHEWFGVSLAGTLILHLLLHWRWIVSVGRRFLRRLVQSSRLLFIVDSTLFVAFTAVGLSGLLISRSFLPSLGVTLAVSPVWRLVHSAAANAVLGLVGLHLALHRRWIWTMIRRYLLPARLFNFKGNQAVLNSGAQSK